MFEISLVLVAVVDENAARQVQFPGIAPGAEGPGADAGAGIDHQHQHVSGGNGIELLAAEIGVSGRVHKEEMGVLPGAIEHRRIKAALLFLLFLAEVGDAGAGVNTALAGNRTGLEEHQIGQRGLARAGHAG